MTGTLGIPRDRLWVTVYKEDDEAERIWIEEIGVDPTRCTRMGEKSNFWSMGETGPCGPCTEIFYDHGPEIAGGPPGSPDEDGDRYVENLEPGVHAVRPLIGRHFGAASQAVGRHRNGSRARRCRHAGRAQ